LNYYENELDESFESAEEVIDHYIKAKGIVLNMHVVGSWLRFEDSKPVIGQMYLLVWDNYPPEKRTWQEEDNDRDFTGLRWLPIADWK